MNIFIMIIMLTLMIPATAATVYAATGQEMGHDGKSIVDVGNKICPVMGGNVDGKTFVVYKGKRYGLCCPGCDKTFLNDPEKYIAKIKATENL
jgi:YHS domain-containing protein